MKRKKALVAAASVAALTLSLAACGGSSDDDNGSSSSGNFTEGASSAGDKDPTAEGPAPEIEGAKTGGETVSYTHLTLPTILRV